MFKQDPSPEIASKVYELIRKIAKTNKFSMPFSLLSNMYLIFFLAATILLFDGSPMYKKDDLLFKIAHKEKITLLGVSAKYIDALRKLKSNLKYKYKTVMIINTQNRV